MKGPFVCRAASPIFMRPRRIVWKPQIAKKIGYFDVRFYGNGTLRVAANLQMLPEKKKKRRKLWL